MGLKG
jgi:hypothetical protein